jgi:hypothetical protein
MPFGKSARSVVSSRMTAALAARPRVLAFLLVVTLSLGVGVLSAESLDAATWTGVMVDGKSNTRP